MHQNHPKPWAPRGLKKEALKTQVPKKVESIKPEIESVLANVEAFLARSNPEPCCGACGTPKHEWGEACWDWMRSHSCV